MYQGLNQDMQPPSSLNSSAEASPERGLNTQSRWYELLQVVLDAMHNNGKLRVAHNHVTAETNQITTEVEHHHVTGSNPGTHNMTSSSSAAIMNGSCVDGWQRTPLLESEHKNVNGKTTGGNGSGGVIAGTCWDDDGLRPADRSVAEYYDDDDDDDGDKKGHHHHLSGRNGAVKISMPAPEREEQKYPREKWKTLVAFAFVCANWILTTMSLAIVHERLPDRNKYPPLPDVFFDLFEPLDWALDVSEVLIIISVNLCVLVIVVHRHRLIICRRVFLMLGLLYMMRSVTMFVTQVPVASTTYYCSPKANSTSPLLVVKRVLQLLSGLGLSINGQHTYCGDYIYSGHTVILTMAYLVIKEYSPRRCFPIHWLSWVLSLIGVVMVLVSRGHYTVDVIIAYYVTTRVFWIYHTMCNNAALKVPGTNNYIARVWWFCIFVYFEKNVGGIVPRQYEWPLPWPRKFKKHNRNS